MAERDVREEVDPVPLDALQERQEVELRYDDYGHLQGVSARRWFQEYCTHPVEGLEVHDNDDAVDV